MSHVSDKEDHRDTTRVKCYGRGMFFKERTDGGNVLRRMLDAQISRPTRKEMERKTENKVERLGVKEIRKMWV